MKLSKTGYRKNSKDKDEKSLMIPSGNISMKNVLHPVIGVDNMGNMQMMHPGGEYQFDGDSVMEFPVKNRQFGGGMQGLDLNKAMQFLQSSGMAQQLLQSMQQGGEPITPGYQIQHGGFSKMPASELRRVWELTPENKGKPYTTKFEQTKNSEGVPYFNYYLYGADQPKPAVNTQVQQQASQQKQTPKILDPMKQSGFNGLITDNTSNNMFAKGGGLDKFVKNYTATGEAPQGMSMDDLLDNKKDSFVDYVAANDRMATLKKELVAFKQNDGRFQMGGANSGDDPSYYQDMFFSAQNGDPNYKAPSKTNNNFPTGWNTSFGTESKGPSFIPGKNSPEMKQFVDTGQHQSGVDIGKEVKADPEDIMARMEGGNPLQGGGGMGSAGYADIALNVMRGITGVFEGVDANRKAEILARRQTIENQAPRDYGSRGNYDTNTGVFRPDQYTTPIYQKGGEKDSLDPNDTIIYNRDGNKLLNLSISEAKNKHIDKQNKDYYKEFSNRGMTEDEYFKKYPSEEEFNKQNIIDRMIKDRRNGTSGVGLAKGGSKKCFKKGGTYTVKEDDIKDLIAQGIDFEFID